MSNDFKNYKPPECLLLLDGNFNRGCLHTDAQEWAKQLLRENPDSLVDVYTHAGTMRVGQTQSPAENDNVKH